jgi:flagellar biosynthesis chaperone FliJ
MNKGYSPITPETPILELDAAIGVRANMVRMYTKAVTDLEAQLAAAKSNLSEAHTMLDEAEAEFSRRRIVRYAWIPQ